MAERSHRRRSSLLGTIAVVLAPLIVAFVKLLWTSKGFTALTPARCARSVADSARGSRAGRPVEWLVTIAHAPRGSPRGMLLNAGPRRANEGSGPGKR